MKKNKKITKEMKISQVLQKYPQSQKVFIKYGLLCFFCPFAQGEQGETIEEASKIHKINLKKFMKDLNEAIS